MTRYDTETRKKMVLSSERIYEISAMGMSRDWLIIGDHGGWITARKFGSTRSLHLTVSRTMINSIEVSRHSNDNRFLVTSNDKIVKIYSMDSLLEARRIEFPINVNATAVSPDGKKLLVVGDSNQIFLHDASASASYGLVKTLRTPEFEHSGGSVSCSWNASSTKFAVSTQQGPVYVWDVRSSQYFARIIPEQRYCSTHKVQFSPTHSVDLLLIAEQTNYFHIVDARSFDQKQTIRVSSVHEDIGINGAVFSPDSRSVYIAKDEQIVEYKIDATGRRTNGFGAFC